MKTITSLGVLLLCAGLAGCGGGGGDAPAPPPTDRVPDSANASSNGMVAWLKRLAARAPDDEQALDASGFAPPHPDDSEPEAL